ncbi:hypothetical protein ACU21_03650 [Actinobaculum suis]|nr:hypothetical protein ACU20_05070 [Actinobaculum suis]OCA95607.1 hypothetical protein ACU21_03650 [Actinobaculum suis]
MAGRGKHFAAGLSRIRHTKLTFTAANKGLGRNSKATAAPPDYTATVAGNPNGPRYNRFAAQPDRGTNGSRPNRFAAQPGRGSGRAEAHPGIRLTRPRHSQTAAQSNRGPAKPPPRTGTGTGVRFEVFVRMEQ